MHKSTEQKKDKAIRLTRTKNQKGNAAIQTAITLMVGVVLLIGAVGAYKYIGQAKNDNEINEITDLKNSTVRLGQSMGVFNSTDITTANLRTLNFFPANRIITSGTGATATTTVNNQWGGAITVAVANVASAAAADGIAFTYAGVPKANCLDIVTKLDGIAETITVAGTVTKAANAKSNISTVATQCSTADTVSVIYTLTK
jgi:hypothetical protein